MDERIRTLIENGVKTRHRSMFVIIGDKSRDQVLSAITRYFPSFLLRLLILFCFEQIVNLHYMLSKAVIKSRPTVLWCYKDKLELSRLASDIFLNLELNYSNQCGSVVLIGLLVARVWEMAIQWELRD